MSMKVCNLDNILKYHCTLDKNVDFYAVPHSKCILETGRVFTAQATRKAPRIIPLHQGIVLIQGSNLHLPHCRQILYHLRHWRSP